MTRRAGWAREITGPLRWVRETQVFQGGSWNIFLDYVTLWSGSWGSKKSRLGP